MFYIFQCSLLSALIGVLVLKEEDKDFGRFWKLMKFGVSAQPSAGAPGL